MKGISGLLGKYSNFFYFKMNQRFKCGNCEVDQI